MFATSPPVDREGWLQKRGEVNKNWQRRYFVLKGNLLFYFEKKGDREPLGVIILEGCTIGKLKSYIPQVRVTHVHNVTWQSFKLIHYFALQNWPRMENNIVFKLCSMASIIERISSVRAHRNCKYCFVEFVECFAIRLTFFHCIYSQNGGLDESINVRRIWIYEVDGCRTATTTGWNWRDKR